MRGNGMSSTASQNCAFCRIIAGEEKSYLVFEDELAVAFLDRRPVFQGHCLLVPREHHETLLDLPSTSIGPLFGAAQLLARAVQRGMEAQGTFVAINNYISQSVPHLHVHVVPRRKGDGLRGFFWPRTRYENEDAIVSAQHHIRSAVAAPAEQPPES